MYGLNSEVVFILSGLKSGILLYTVVYHKNIQQHFYDEGTQNCCFQMLVQEIKPLQLHIF